MNNTKLRNILIAAMLALCSIVVLPSCVTGNKQAIIDAANTVLAKGNTGFDMADKAVSAESDPVKQTQLKLAVAQAKMEFDMLVSNFINLVTNGSYSIDDLNKILAAAEQARLEYEAIKNTIKSKPATSPAK